MDELVYSSCVSVSAQFPNWGCPPSILRLSPSIFGLSPWSVHCYLQQDSDSEVLVLETR